jgi:hypothetical protein
MARLREAAILSSALLLSAMRPETRTAYTYFLARLWKQHLADFMRVLPSP